ncbi:LON peptidase substrate-binding domain-containing protein [Alteriqipengyuania flavescens]|uniref:LON peptidase substrate-binding domain-containing protein n=1 Tax=Alteriqipengyuania flavescens TaxID=3053610 RepID=UPI0025B2E237|nr:LON peptidase substrate-binding domain-containing protein [Alteriqipengyuania flavescens]WJY19307.1 LON peptidase substrate-binding domain-containing protein [Alteriqipengyuania flavescens]WJY25248.1 LON peptidase substrate-binding domain-containing protein [Alteriqipengyuania flavescens]
MRLSIFPLPGAVLFPGLQLPLHIFEPRYRALVGDALARDRRIAMIQPQQPRQDSPLFAVGCTGIIEDVETTEDGRYNIVLEGEQRFRMIRELDVDTLFRQIEAEMIDEPEYEYLSSVERASLEQESRRFADVRGYSVDWDSVERLDDVSLVNGVSQIAPFDPAAKQALLEAASLKERCELLVQLMQFFGAPGGDEDRVTLQ